MRTIDIRDYVVGRWGDWINDGSAFTATLFRLDHADDGVTLSGPLRVQVSVQARNVFLFPGTNRLAYQAKELFCYVLEIPPGQTWTYPGPRHALNPWEYVAPPPPGRALADRIIASSGDVNSTMTITTDDPSAYGFGPGGGTGQPAHTATPVRPPPANVDIPGWVVVPPPPPGGTKVAPPPAGPTVVMPPPPRFGSNAGVSVVIRPAGSASCQDPCADPCVDPCATGVKHCGCGSGSTCGGGCGSGQCGCGSVKTQCGCNRPPSQCGCGGIETLPCDFAVASRPNAGRFFPVGCESCSPSAIVAMPALQGPALLVPPARGGTVRTRYFTGMFIGKEDLETDQRNVRLKRALMNRAMGQGVVWGLGVGLDGDGVCVRPGYGVDCCGNDLILSQTYRVEGGALVRDPAAQAILALPGPHRLSLVLEYFECPEAPRPVHGDPCANDTRCEPSRMRETVRLRLAPPCEVDDSGPIKTYLEEVAALKKDVNATGVASGPELTSFMQPLTSQPAPALRVPFGVSIDDSGNSVLALQPQVNAEVRGDGVLAATPNKPLPALTISLRAEAGVSFRNAPVTQVLTFDPQTGATQQMSKPMQTVSTPSMISWDVPLPGPWWNDSAQTTTPIPAAMSFDIGPWEMQDQNGATFQGTAAVDLTPMLARAWKYSTPTGKASSLNPVLTDTIIEAAVRAKATVTVSPPSRFPCLTEPCGDGTRKLFPVMPPFMHEDPANPGQPADAKVIMLAVLYAYTSGTMAKNRAGTPFEIQNAQTDLAGMLGRVSSQLFFARTTGVQQTQLVGALQRLLEAWCRCLLYPGPQCCCEPHGAVIGCATVEGGVIQSVDPWGGRRWVMHYPLLAYWGQQFGIMPPDAIASKLFDLICCMANVGATRPPSASGAGDWSKKPSPPEPVPLGRMLLFTGTHQEVTDALAAANVSPVRTIHLNPVDFVSRVTRASAGGELSATQPLVRVAVAGVPGITVVMPDDETAAPTAPASATAAAATPTARPTPLSDILRSASSRTGKTALPLLLRGLAESIASRITDAMPLVAENRTEQAVVDRLRDAGLTTLTRLLDKDPEAVHGVVLQKESAIEFGAVLDRSAKLVQGLADKVSDTLASYAQEHGLAAREGFADPRVAADFAKTLGASLKRSKLAAPSDEVVAAAVAAATSAA